MYTGFFLRHLATAKEMRKSRFGYHMLMPCFKANHRQQSSRLVLLGETEGLVAAIEDGEVLLEQHVTEDLHALATVTLHTTEASVGANIRERDVLARDRGHEAAVADLHTKVRNVGVARVDITTRSRGDRGALNLLVESLRDSVIDEQEGGTSVGDSAAGSRVLVGLTTDTVGGRSELPETIAGVHWSEVDISGILAGVDGTELVSASGVVLEVSGEERLVEVINDAIEEGLLGLRLHGVDGAERKTEETVVVLVGNERAGKLSGKLDSLAGSGGTPDIDSVETDSTGSTATVAVLDLPRPSLVLLPS